MIKNKLKLIVVIGSLLLSTTSIAQVPLDKFDTGVFTEDSILNSFILKWLGKPYKLGGKTEKGIDCSQFTKRLYKDVYGKELENVAYKQWNQTKRVKRDSLQVGDIVFFRSRQSPSGWHCGAYIGNTYFVHAANKFEGVKVSSLNEPRYVKSYRGSGRLKN
jgi:cell wall-associated NlpC family hydrolase